MKYIAFKTEYNKIFSGTLVLRKFNMLTPQNNENNYLLLNMY